MSSTSAASWSIEVLVWWLLLCVAAVFNLSVWVRMARVPIVDSGRRKQLALALVFALVCGFRGVVPRADVQRIVLFDTWLSSVMLGRAVATVAELSLMAQLSLYLYELAEEAGLEGVRRLSLVIVPLIAMAECCSWYAVISTNYLGNTCEESIWTLSAALLIVGYALVSRRAGGRTRALLRRGLGVGGGYVAFMLNVDVPMYFGRWRADQAAGRAYLAPLAGLHDVATRWVTTRSFSDWRTEMPWMGLYFTVAVWVSLSLVRAPRLDGGEVPG